MDRLRAHSVAIVEQVRSLPLSSAFDIYISSQALLVGQELVRVAMLWHELWFEGLEEASRFYITHKNPEGMIAVLAPLHDVLDEVRAEFKRLVINLKHFYISAGPHNTARNDVRTIIWASTSRSERALPLL